MFKRSKKMHSSWELAVSSSSGLRRDEHGREVVEPRVEDGAAEPEGGPDNPICEGARGMQSAEMLS